MGGIIGVTPENIIEKGLYCLKDQKTPGFITKKKWFEDQFKNGLRLKIILNERNEQAGFIEYTPAEEAWRPVKADNHLFIHCMFIYPKKNSGLGFGTKLIEDCIQDAKDQDLAGIAVMTSKGSWMASNKLFLKNGFKQIDKRGRFELMLRSLDGESDASFLDWETRQKDYQGWNLLYANQCPWHAKSVEMMKESGRDLGIQLKVHEIKTAREAQYGPSGFGVFALLHNGKLLEDHYLSERRFTSIVKNEL